MTLQSYFDDLINTVFEFGGKPDSPGVAMVFEMVYFMGALQCLYKVNEANSTEDIDAITDEIALFFEKRTAAPEAMDPETMQRVHEYIRKRDALRRH